MQHQSKMSVLHLMALICTLAVTSNFGSGLNVPDQQGDNQTDTTIPWDSETSTPTPPQLNGVPLGTIVAWVNSPSKDGNKVPLPDGWQPCDGSLIHSPSIWAGQKTPNLNGEKRFLRGGPFEDMLNMEEETTRLPDHTHIDNGHTHTATSSADPHSHGYSDRNALAVYHGSHVAGGNSWDFPNADDSRTTVAADVNVKTIIQKTSSNITGVKDHDGFPTETKPINMNVLYIMKIF